MTSVLLSAYQCGPGMGSVSQIGWEWYQRLCQETSVTLVTHIRNQAALTAAGAPLNNSEIIYIDSEWFAGPLYRLAKRCFPNSEHPVFLISSLDFFVFDWLALKELKKRRNNGARWDVIHAPTPVSPKAATRLHRLNIPLILGPWNGGLPSPEHFPDIMRAESRWIYAIGQLGKVLDKLTGTTRRASLIFSANNTTDRAVPANYRDKICRLLENGVDLDIFKAHPYPPFPSPTQALQIVFVGRLLPFKGLPMLLEALSQVDFPFQLNIIGEGPEREKLHTLIQQWNLESQVELLGNRPLNFIAERIAEAHVLCLPSIRESGGAVLLEAMAVARPVIAVDYGGPSETVDETVGIKLPATGKQAVIDGLIAALRDIYEHPQQWQQKGIKGREKVEQHYSWPAKIKTALSHYHQLTGLSHE